MINQVVINLNQENQAVQENQMVTSPQPETQTVKYSYILNDLLV